MMTPVHRVRKSLRARTRFSIQEEVRYESLGKRGYFGVGRGTSLEVSSREVRFTTEHELRQGQKIRLAMNWPALLDGNCRLQLQVCGQVVEATAGEAAVRIVRYEFHTLRTQGDGESNSPMSRLLRSYKEQRDGMVRSMAQGA